MKTIFALPLCAALLVACGDDSPDPTTAPPVISALCAETPTPADWSVSACDVGVANPTRLIVTTTDFSTGAVTVVDATGKSATTDVALASTDAVPFYHDGLLYVVNRYGQDYIDVLDPSDGYALAGEHAVTLQGVASTNPQGIAFGPNGLAFVPLFGAPYVLVYDFSKATGAAHVATIDLSRFADADGNTELSIAFACGDTIFVGARRLDPSFLPVDDEILIPIHAPTPCIWNNPITLRGRYAKQARLDPTDQSGTSLYILTTGIERLDAETGDVTWRVDAADFAAVGLEGYDIQSFALHGEDAAYVAAYNDDYAVDVWRVTLDGSPSIEMVISGLGANEKTLEIIGDELWFGDTTSGASGIRVFDLTASPPSEIAGPLSTGLAPYSMTLMP